MIGKWIGIHREPNKLVETLVTQVCMLLYQYISHTAVSLLISLHAYACTDHSLCLYKLIKTMSHR
jgi:hypothetical protein